MNMNPSRSPVLRTLPAARTSLAWAAGLALVAAAGCHKGSVGKSISGLTPGSIALAPNQAPGSVLAFMVAPNAGGRATSVRLTGVRWGKLADIRDQDGNLRHKDFVVNEDVVSNSSYLVENNPVTEKTTVTILAPYSTFNDSPYATKLADLEAELTVLEDKSLDPSELPPFPLVPRNAAIVLEFDDLLDPNAINAQTIKLLSGYPPTAPFDTRIVPDTNHGDLANFDGVPGLEYYTTRIILDTTVSSLEAASTNPPLPVNTLGLPASITVGQPNIVLRIPTQVDADTAQTTLLRNPTNHFLASSGNGSIDFESGSRDLVRALRSGGGALGDVNNGFLKDVTRPSVLGTQAVFVQNLAAGPTPQTFVCDLAFSLPTCANRLAAGDVIQQGSVFAEVICPPFQNCLPDAQVTGSQVGNLVSTVYFRILATDNTGSQVLEVGPAQVAMRYTVNVLAGKAPCFVRFPTLTLPPDQGVSPSSSVIVRFSEPMDPASIRPFDSFTVLRRDPAVATTLNAYDYVVGAVGGSSDSREFTFTPSLPMTHLPPATESYWVRVADGASGARDLSGNTLATQVPAVLFRLDSAASIQNTGGFALRFASADELSGIGGDTSTTGVGKREFRGQFLINTETKAMRPRPVTHFPATIDRTQSLPGAMIATGTGTQTPLSKLGSKMQTLWRYFDAGFTLEDEANFNVDVEGIAWAPIGSAVVADNFTRFEMSLSHSLRLPDESFNQMTQTAVFPNSGVVSQYSLNVLNSAEDPQRTLYPVTGGPSGYAVIPTDIYQGSTGSKFMPWPMNRGVPTRNFVFYTWRDTSIRALGGPLTSGANPLIWYTVNGIAPPTTGNPPVFAPIFAPNAIPSHAMPLLLEFRCYPDDDALGLNVFDVSMATPAGTVPNFRAFSTGGVNTQNQIIRKDPDVQTVASGGFNPASTPLPGAATLPVDNTFYMGQLNLVTRVSRAHSIWFDSTSATVIYGTPVLEPRASEQPAGTSIAVEYRGATTLTNTVLLSDSNGLDPYGNRITTGTVGGTGDPTFLNNDSNWFPSLTGLNGARFFQARLTYVSNAETNLSPEVTSLGFCYRR